MSKEPVKGDYIEDTMWTTGPGPDYDEYEFTYKIFHMSYDFARDQNWDCAFCHGDPCAEQGEGLIALYREAEGKGFETCPVCKGRAS